MRIVRAFILMLCAIWVRSTSITKRRAHSTTMSGEFHLPISSVVAVTPSWGIGLSGTLPWAHAGKHLPADIAYFKRVTSQTSDSSKMNAVFMGKETWLSIPTKYRPLPGRLNVILSSTLSSSLETELPDVLIACSFEDALEKLSENTKYRSTIERIVVIGGARLFEESFFHPWFDTLHLTQVQEEFAADTFLTKRTIEALSQVDFESLVTKSLQEDGVKYRLVKQLMSIH